MDCIEQHEAEDFAESGYGLQERHGVGVMVLGGCDAWEFDVAQQRIVRGDERQIDGGRVSSLSYTLALSNTRRWPNTRLHETAHSLRSFVAREANR